MLPTSWQQRYDCGDILARISRDLGGSGEDRLAVDPEVWQSCHSEKMLVLIWLSGYHIAPCMLLLPDGMQDRFSSRPRFANLSLTHNPVLV